MNKLKGIHCPWCVCDSKGNVITFECQGCGEKHIFNNSGMTIVDFVEKSEAFCELHKNCDI